MKPILKLCLATLLPLFTFACGSKPTGDSRYIVTNNDAGAVAIIFAEPRDNKQYCIYRKDFALDSDAPVGPLNMQTNGDAQLLTPRTIAIQDLRRAVQTESVHTTYTLSSVAYAIFPTSTLCLATFTAWVASRNASLGRATLLLCAAGATFIGAAFTSEAEGSKKVSAAVDAIISPEMHRANEILPRIEKVLTWLVTENSLPCNEDKETKAAP